MCFTYITVRAYIRITDICSLLGCCLEWPLIVKGIPIIVYAVKMADLYEPDVGTAYYRSADPVKNLKLW